jgi:Ni/Fe-hydrogenase subunit HybB-like protein
MTFWLRGLETGLGRRGASAAFIAAGVGLAAFATGLHEGESARTFAALIASGLFFAGVAAGSLAFVAVFRIIDARWARPLAARAAVFAGFAPVALILLTLILAGARLAPWLPAETSGSAWLRLPRLAARELGLAFILWLSARRLLRSGSGGTQPRNRAPAVIYCLIYAVVLSVWAFDFVLGPDPSFESTLIGPFVFMVAFTAGTGLLVLLGLANRALSEAQRRDAGAMVLALSIFWAYLFWSQYLTIWYGDLPQETAFALRRAQAGWGPTVLMVIGLVFAVPFVMLLNPRGRKSARVLEGVIVVQLVGLWLNCHLLVVPSLASPGAPPITVRDALIALGTLGAFALSSGRRYETDLVQT